jgi:hypothetical protein
MSCFDDITITWDEQEFVVKSNMVMGLIEAIEGIVTLEEINEMLSSKKIARTKLARAYASALSYAGAKVTSEDVYNKFFGGEGFVSTVNSLIALMSMMIPPEHLRAKNNPKPQEPQESAS